MTVTFAAMGGATDLVLVHEPMGDPAVWAHHRNGWLLACDRMEALALT